MTTDPPPGLTRFNTLSDSAARTALNEVCASTAWASELLAHRPYDTTDALRATSDTATAGLTADDLAEAMGGHPPIGRPKPGDPTSAREQRGMAGASDVVQAEVLELNLAYQDRFGHVFLICATGRTGEQMRDAVRIRIGNTPEQEWAVVRTELGKINRIRLTRLVQEDSWELVGARGSSWKQGSEPLSTETTASVSTHILDTSVGRPAESVAVSLSARGGAREPWMVLGRSATDADGRCEDLPALPEGTTHVRLDFETEAYFHGRGNAQSHPQSQTHTYTHSHSQKQAEAQQDAPALRDSGAFFPEVAITFAVTSGEHFHVPLLLNPFGYSVYRGS